MFKKYYIVQNENDRKYLLNLIESYKRAFTMLLPIIANLTENLSTLIIYFEIILDRFYPCLLLFSEHIYEAPRVTGLPL